jgi:hypothetical protein
MNEVVEVVAAEMTVWEVAQDDVRELVSHYG